MGQDDRPYGLRPDHNEPRLCRNRRFAPVIQSYDGRDSVLYALSLGIGDDPLDEDELPYVYEGRAPRAVPS